LISDGTVISQLSKMGSLDFLFMATMMSVYDTFRLA
jgi:hypothetical protein